MSREAWSALFRLPRRVIRMSSDRSATSRAGGPVGQVGHVTVPVRGASSPGEIELTVAGLPETYIAYSTDRIARDGAVLVIHDRGSRSVDVVPWAFPPGLGVDDAAGRQER